MSIADSFRERVIAGTMAGVVALGSIAAAFTASAQEPVAPPARAVATQPANMDGRTPAQQEVSAELIEAYKYSTTGVSIVIVMNKNEQITPAVDRDLKAIMSATKDRGVPRKIFGFESSAQPSHAYLIVDNMTFRKPPANNQDYSMKELRDLGGDAISLYRQSQQYKARQAASPSHPLPTR